MFRGALGRVGTRAVHNRLTPRRRSSAQSAKAPHSTEAGREIREKTRIIAAMSNPDVQLLDIVGPLEAFNLAAQQLIAEPGIQLPSS